MVKFYRSDVPNTFVFGTLSGRLCVSLGWCERYKEPVIMKAASLLILSVLHAATTIKVETLNKTSSYDAAELLSKIFNPNITLESRQRGYGFVKFENQPDDIDVDIQDSGQHGLVGFERDQRPLRFDDDQNYNPYDSNGQNDDRPLKFEDSDPNQNLAFNNGGVTFQDDNKLDDQGTKKKRKRRRRRKPKNGVLPYLGADGGLPPGRPEFQGPVQGGYGPNPYENLGYPGTKPLRRPHRPRPRPSLATEALSSIIEALTSIARYDDYQCVPRLLCEAAGGGTLSENGVLQSIAGLQPLLALLSAYNGISTSPLFVFGRAVFLGMTSKGNTGTCRYAYPQCPTDPEQLIYYLNNHNGGFFRFFSSPQVPNQNVEQFYNQLSQGYGHYQPNIQQQNYGYPNDPNSGQYYGFNPNEQNQAYPGADTQNYEQNYDNQRPGPYDRPSLYNDQNYGPNYAYDYNNYGSGNQIQFQDNNARLEKRIQNQPTQNLADDSFEDDVFKTKWQFPDVPYENIGNNEFINRDIRTLKFPEEGQSYYNSGQKQYKRKEKQLHFPDNQNNQNYYDDRYNDFQNNNRYQTTTHSYDNDQNYQNYYNTRPNINNNNYYKPGTKYQNYDYEYNPYQHHNYQNNQNYYNDRQNIYNNNYKYPTTTYNNEEYVFDHKNNFYVKKENNYYNYSNNANNHFKRMEVDDGLKTVYVVRGNGDPNKPEIVKLRPGQSVY